MNLLELLNNENVDLKKLTEDLNDKVILGVAYSDKSPESITIYAKRILKENEEWLSSYSEVEKNSECSKNKQFTDLFKDYTEDHKRRLRRLETDTANIFNFDLLDFKKYIKK